MQADIIEQWLSRFTPARGVNDSIGLPIVLATEIGLSRTENQDRAASLIAGPTISTSQSIIAIAIADGMGGMRDGGKCASLALSSFFSHLAHSQEPDLKGLVENAVLFANSEVFSLYGGKGGSTLATVVISSTGDSVLAHLGDSRIFLARQHEKVTRLTIDDSLEEAVGGHGRELLQYVGMGLGCKPHISDTPHNSTRLILTTDGIHFLEHSLLYRVFQNCHHNRALVDRLAALTRWAGGPDNATAAIVDVASIQKNFPTLTPHQVTVSDPFSSIYFAPEQKRLSMPTKETASVVGEAGYSSQSKKEEPVAEKLKKTRKRKKTSVQLEFKVEPLSVTDDKIEDSK